MITFGADICSNLTEARQREWLETNGLGGFASSTRRARAQTRHHDRHAGKCQQDDDQALELRAHRRRLVEGAAVGAHGKGREREEVRRHVRRAQAGEVLLASKGGKKDEIVYEIADLFFHTLMVLGYHGIGLNEIYQELAKRFGKSGLRPEK